MFDNVIIGVDGRRGGRDAVVLALRLAQPGASVTLAHVYGGAYLPSHAVVPGRVREDREAAEELLADERSRLEREVEVVAKQSASPARGLHELAEARQAGLLVLGSCHRATFGRAMLGDDTRAGLNGAPCAVAVAPQGYALDPRSLDSIGVAYDATPESGFALAAARELAGATGAAIHALRVVTAPRYLFTGNLPPAGIGIDELVKAAEAEMETLDGVETEVRYGAIDPDLEEFSTRVDLLVVGSRAFGPAMRLIEGSTSRFLLALPVLLAPRRGPPGHRLAADAPRLQARRSGSAGGTRPAQVPSGW